MDKKYSLLIVDDETDIVDQLYDFFRRDYEIHKAYSGEDAAKILEDNDVQLVMTDQRMPQMQGTELLAMLKEKKPETTRILMTGYTDLEVAIEAINKGSIHRYLQKPLNFDELSGIIQEGLSFYEESSKVKNLITQEKDDILGKLKGVFTQIQDVQVDKGKLEEELQAAKEVEGRMRQEMENKITELEQEKVKTDTELRKYKDEYEKVSSSLDKALAEAEKAKQMKEENVKIQAELKEIEAKFALVDKTTASLKEDVKKVQQERDTALAEKNRIEKKLKQFQANWGK